MERIKKFIEEFAQAEAKISTLKTQVDLEPYNQSLPEYYQYYVKELHYALIHKPMENRSKSDVFLREIMMEDNPSKSLVFKYKPRHLFKISQYMSKKYGKVWVAYVSWQDPSLHEKKLRNAFFILEEENSLAIARIYFYSNFSTNSPGYIWEGEAGYEDLTFESLEGPVKIERYQAPISTSDGLKSYEAEV